MGLRDMTAQCGQPTALSQLTNNLNPSVLADASLYKQGPQINNNGANPMQQQTVPTASNLMHEFNQSKPLQPMQVPMAPQPQQQQQRKPEQDINKLYQQHTITPNSMQMVVQPQRYHVPQPMPMMNIPQMMVPNPMNMHYQMPPQIYSNMMQQNIPQKQVKRDDDSKQQDIVNTNGTKDMKNEQEVQSELDSLHPTHRDINQINQLLDDTKSDDKMQNSQFMNFLRNLKNKPPVNEQMDQSQLWANQFQGWNDPNDVDNMNWDSYMEAIDPTKANDPEYKFSEENHFAESKENENVNYFEEGIRLMSSGNLNEAILAFEACVKKEPNRSEAWRYLGICHADNENENGAISAYLKCHSLDNYDLDALLQLGVSYTNEIDPFRALNYLKQWIANHPDYSMLAEMEEKQPMNAQNANNGMLGGWNGSKQEHKKVVSMFNKALSINGMDSDLHIVLGVLYNITSEFDVAENHFKKAIQSKPKDPSLWNKLGATQANGGKCKDAIRAYSKALQLKPNYVRALSNLGISFANQDMHKEACQSYLASLKLNNEADSVWDHLTMSLMDLNRGDLVELCKHKDVKYFKNHFDF